MSVSVLNRESVNYYGGFFEIQAPQKKNSISFLRGMLEKLNTRMLEKSEELLILVDDALNEIKTTKIRSNFNYDEHIETIEIYLSHFTKLNNLLNDFEIDDPFIQKVVDTNAKLYKKFEETKGLYIEYKEVNEARNEIKSGNTVNIEELLNELQN